MNKSLVRASGDDESPVIYDSKRHRLSIFCRVTREMVLRVETTLDEFFVNQKGSSRKLEIIVNSPGGDALQGAAIYDLCRSMNIKIKTVGLGEIASSSIAIFLAGHERWMHENSIIHFHRTAMEFNQSLKIVEGYQFDIERRQIKAVDDIYAGIILANSKLTRRQINKLDNQGTYLGAEEAVRLGLAHKIISNT